MATHIYGYFEDIDEFRPTTIKQWQRKIKPTGVKKYLSNHLLKSLKDDFPVAFKSFRKKKVGYFALPRIIFPYITFLGSLYKGKDETKSALLFIEEYMGRVAPEYKYLAGIFYIGYRHGLLHTNMPKIFTYASRNFGWWITFAKATKYNRGDILKGNKLFYPQLFYSDLCKAINLYIKDFDDTKKQINLLENFKKGFTEMSKIYTIKDVGSRSKKFLIKSLRYLKKFTPLK